MFQGLLAGIVESAKFMYDISRGNCETFFSDLFQLTSKKHKIKTRQATSGKFSLPPGKTNYKSKHITNFGVKIWNDIPKNIRTSTKKIFGNQ